jgi:hypothetical protein
MEIFGHWTGRVASATALSAAAVLAAGGIAHADNIQDTITDTSTGVTLVAGSGAAGTAAIRLVGNSSAGDADSGCNIDAGEAPLVLDVVTPDGVAATPDPLEITGCGTDFPLSFTAAPTAVSGKVTVRVVSGPAGGGSYVNQVDIPITVTQPSAPADTEKPTITHTTTPSTPNANGWYREDVSVDFTCEDAGSGIESCTGDTTLTEDGADHSVTGTATDRAGNTATATASGIRIDRTAPVVDLVGGPAAGAEHYFGNVPAAPECAASDALSGLDGDCVVTGGGSTVGAHTYTATATDRAGNTTVRTLDYTVKAWTLQGFTAPVDMGSGVWNSVKGGSTVPLKFEVFSGATELTGASAVKSFTQKTVGCPGPSATVDEIEQTITGGTALRYDTTAGQFVQTWQTPKKPGTCAQVTMTTQDDSKIVANFMFR